MSKVKATFPEIFDSWVFTTVSIQETSGAWVRRILIWLIATQAITGSVSVHVDVQLEARAPVEVQKEQRAEMPGKHAHHRRDGCG
jgi:hypothetical protein